jgi:hypothetical protein
MPMQSNRIHTHSDEIHIHIEGVSMHMEGMPIRIHRQYKPHRPLQNPRWSLAMWERGHLLRLQSRL